MLRIAVIFFAVILSLSPSRAGEKPNFVLIFIDDMGYGDIGPFGSKVNSTPNLDQMAAEGRKMTSFYAAPVCSASRAQLLTGSYAPRVSVPGVFFPAGKNGLNPDEMTVADYLKELGYATACIGKWHLGDQLEFLPTRNGFDSYFGIPYSNDMGRTDLKSGLRVHPLMRNEQVAELLEDEGQRLITREYTEKAVKFIEEKSGSDKPFFLYFPHTAMHVPLFPHEEFVGKSENGVYGDWVAEVDWSVGQVLETLKRLKIEKETLVVFTSDNGPWASKGDAGGVAGPLRGSKGCTLEGGVREPTIAWWPGKIAPGTESAAIAGTTDILPTFVSLAGGKTRDDIVIDGYDLSGVLLGTAQKTDREAWYYYRGSNLEAVRSGPWKLAVTKQSIGMGMKEQPEDLLKGGRLYHLEEDIGEVTDLSAKHPEILNSLQALAEGAIAEMKANTRPVGVVENPVTLYPTAPGKSKSKTKSKSRPKKGKPIDWSQLKKGDAIPPESAPDVSGKSFTLSCEIDSAAPSGVVVAQGGSQVGYSLYLKDGKAVFAVRNSADIRRVSAGIEAGKNTLTARLEKGGLSLKVGEGDWSSEKSPGLLSRHPAEDFCVGHDNKNVLDSEAPAGIFSGDIGRISLQID